ncbi:MAG: hypothetical protein LBF15_01675 [Candidatus Peribacteria bacterium]|jgi:hypothetical protein|nr:hypothetical protein [Candidatus Peribacteria bacterium]
MQNTQIELISIKGGEPLTEPIDENDTKKFFIELNSKERDYHKGYIEALNNLF